MGRTTGLLQKGYTAGGAITKHRILKFGAADGVVLQAAAATDLLVGVQSELSVASGERASAAMVGNIEDVEYGGNVTRGAWLTSDADGKAIAAAPASGANVNVIGQAEISGVSGDIGRVIICPGTMQGA